MKLDKMLTTIRRKTSRAGLVLKKHSPTIGLVLGCVGIVSAAVIACKKTYELPEKIEACVMIDLPVEPDEKLGWITPTLEDDNILCIEAKKLS